MRIMMLSQFYPPIAGGAEYHVQNLARALAGRGHQVSVVTQRHGDMRSFSEDAGVRIYHVRALTGRLPWLFSEPGRQHAPPWPDPETMRTLSQILAYERPQIVHAHDWLVNAFLPLKRSSGAHLVLTLHDYSLVCGSKTSFYHGAACSGPELLKCLGCASAHYGPLKGIPTLAGNWWMKAYKERTVDMFVPVSQAVAEGSGLIHSRIQFQVIPNFLPDALPVGNDDPHLRQLPDEPFIVYVGDLSERKGVNVLLRAYQRLAMKTPLVLIGHPTPTLTASVPPGAIILHNWPHEAVMAAWQRCIFGVVPSVWADPCPTVAMEAMSMGRPLVASQIGGLLDIVADQTTGLLVPPADEESLQQALQRLVSDESLRNQMGERACERVVVFQARTVVPRIEQLYQRSVAA
jgi:glycosyltransferase involved in cell wall biosynthesis